MQPCKTPSTDYRLLSAMLVRASQRGQAQSLTRNLVRMSLSQARWERKRLMLTYKKSMWRLKEKSPTSKRVHWKCIRSRTRWKLLPTRTPTFLLPSRTSKPPGANPTNSSCLPWVLKSTILAPFPTSTNKHQADTLFKLELHLFCYISVILDLPRRTRSDGCPAATSWV